jgi:hypothetical protein
MHSNRLAIVGPAASTAQGLHGHAGAGSSLAFLGIQGMTQQGGPMTQLVALSVSIGVLGAVATWLYLTVGGILIWAGFIAWACFFHAGGDQAALQKTVINNIFGVICGWGAAVLILGVPLAGTLTLPVWAGIAVGIAAFILVMGAHIPLLSAIPAGVYGFGCTFAYLLQTPGKLALPKLMAPSMENALIVVPISMALGAVFGFASAKLGAALKSK